MSSNSKLTAKINLQQVFEGSVTTLENAFKSDVMTAKNGKDYIPLEVLKNKRWVCIDDLAGDHFYHKQTGDVQLQVDINPRREVDKFDNTHSISLQQSKATRESGATRKYCGEGKETIFGVKAAVVASETTAEKLIAEANLQKLEATEELDF
jgi:hypothetical protein